MTERSEIIAHRLYQATGVHPTARIVDVIEDLIATETGEQRVIGHGDGQEHTIADVNAGRIDDMIAPRLQPLLTEIASLRQRAETAEQERDAKETGLKCLRCLLDEMEYQRDALQRDLDTLRGAAAADDERLQQAATRVGVLYVGCDTPDALAEAVVMARRDLDTLKTQLAALADAFEQDANGDSQGTPYEQTMRYATGRVRALLAGETPK
jgi:chromosome segregation ATPase